MAGRILPPFNRVVPLTDQPQPALPGPGPNNSLVLGPNTFGMKNYVIIVLESVFLFISSVVLIFNIFSLPSCCGHRSTYNPGLAIGVAIASFAIPACICHKSDMTLNSLFYILKTIQNVLQFLLLREQRSHGTIGVISLSSSLVAKLVLVLSFGAVPDHFAAWLAKFVYGDNPNFYFSKISRIFYHMTNHALEGLQIYLISNIFLEFGYNLYWVGGSFYTTPIQELGRECKWYYSYTDTKTAFDGNPVKEFCTQIAETIEQYDGCCVWDKNRWRYMQHYY